MARKKSTKTNATSKTTNLDNLSLADGKNQDIEKIKELEAIMGLPKVNAFGTNNLEVLQEKMDNMNTSDLQAFAVRVGLFPSGSRLTLKNKIIKEFHSTAGAGAGFDTGYTKPVADLNTQAGKDLAKLMNEGL